MSILSKRGKSPPARALKGRVAIVTGSSRGIGRECALALAKLGCAVVIAAKTVQPQPTLPGTIHTVAAEVVAAGGQAMAFQLDLRDAKAIEACVAATLERFGRIDILVNNASALWWKNIEDTPAKKYDLITNVNVRGTFLMTKACLPHMRKNGFGRVLTMSPPLIRNVESFSGRTAYNISKFGMTMVALGVTAEYGDSGDNITGHSLWPATVVESLASKNFKMGDPSLWRKATILADCVVRLCCEPGDYTGQMLIDDVYLTDRWGYTEKDFVQYRCDPASEPPRLLAMESEGQGGWGSFSRGSVRDVEVDINTSGNPVDATLKSNL